MYMYIYKIKYILKSEKCLADQFVQVQNKIIYLLADFHSFSSENCCLHVCVCVHDSDIILFFYSPAERFSFEAPPPFHRPPWCICTLHTPGHIAIGRITSHRHTIEQQQQQQKTVLHSTAFPSRNLTEAPTAASQIYGLLCTLSNRP